MCMASPFTTGHFPTPTPSLFHSCTCAEVKKINVVKKKRKCNLIHVQKYPPLWLSLTIPIIYLRLNLSLLKTFRCVVWGRSQTHRFWLLQNHLLRILIFLPLNYVGASIQNQCIINMHLYFWVFTSLLSVLFFMCPSAHSCHSVLISVAL